MRAGAAFISRKVELSSFFRSRSARAVTHAGRNQRAKRPFGAMRISKLLRDLSNGFSAPRANALQPLFKLRCTGIMFGSKSALRARARASSSSIVNEALRWKRKFFETH